MDKNISLLIGLILLGLALFFLTDRLLGNKQAVIHFTEQITSSDFTEGMLKEAKSPEAQHFVDICSQCHITPDPKAHPSEAWPGIVTRMILLLNEEKKRLPSLLIPNPKETRQIIEYMSKKAKKNK